MQKIKILKKLKLIQNYQFGFSQNLTVLVKFAVLQLYVPSCSPRSQRKINNFLPHLDVNRGSQELKASLQQMSNADPLLFEK